MSILLLIVGALLGAACVFIVTRANVGRDRERLRDELKSISLDVLAQTGDSLTARLADQRRVEEERAAGEMARRAEEIKGLVGPMHDKLAKVETELGRLERERRDAHVQLAEMVRSLSAGTDTLRKETGDLVSALKRPETRGSWGEIQLRRVIELAGMVAHCDFTEQHTVHGEDGRLRPDVLVRLPGGKLIVVDSKVPLDAYLAALQSSGEDAAKLLARHARQTREHIAKLASKGYQHQFDCTPELVVMFVPSDGIYQAALAEDPALIEYGVAQQVLMATPTTLIGLLRAVHYGWRQEQIAQSAREIASSARELHNRLGRFVEPLANVGRRLDSAVSAYNEAVGSFDHRVIPQLRRIEQAGAASEREIAAPAAVEASARAITSQLSAAQGDQADDPVWDRAPASPPRLPTGAARLRATAASQPATGPLDDAQPASDDPPARLAAERRAAG